MILGIWLVLFRFLFKRPLLLLFAIIGVWGLGDARRPPGPERPLQETIAGDLGRGLGELVGVTTQWSGFELSELEAQGSYAWVFIIVGLMIVVVAWLRTEQEVALLDEEMRTLDEAGPAESDKKECPVCAEGVKTRAKKLACPHRVVRFQS
jgi:hypothetical protein